MWNYGRCTLLCLIWFCSSIERSTANLIFNANTIATPRIKIIPEAVGNFIYYEYSDAKKIQPYVDSINGFLSAYDSTNQSENLRVCDFNYPPGENDVCTFDRNNLGPCSSQERDYGYSNGSPCVFFRLSQVLDWIPAVLNGSDVQRHSDPFYNIPDHLNTSILLNNFSPHPSKYVWFTCDGENGADKEFIGSVSYYPYKGFPAYYFPFKNLDGYQSPIVAVHFERPQRGVAITIECKVWAKNIQLDRNTGVGFVKFLLLID